MQSGSKATIQSPCNAGRRRVLHTGLAATSLFLPTPYAWVWAQSEGALKLMRAPKFALVVGNSNYRHSPLRNPANDARAIAESLTNTGFDVTARLDAVQTELAQAVQGFTQVLAKSKGVGVFYFAGHGLQLAWRNYMMPVDADIKSAADIQKQGVEVGTLLSGISKAFNPMNVIILDACRDNPFGNLGGVDHKGLSQMDAPPSTLLAYATAPGNVASDGEGVNGLYTEHLLKEIAVPDAKVEDVFKRVRLQVRRRTNGQQIPWESTSLEEDFYFVPPRALAAVAEAEAERERRQQEALREKQRLAEEAKRKRREEQTTLEAKRAEEDAAQKYKQELALREKQRAQQAAPAGKPDAAALERQYQEELANWEKIKTSTEAGPLEDYLLRYPSGRFSEIAQLSFDRILARLGEQKIEIRSSASNPFTKGSTAANTDYKVGNNYAYRVTDLLTGLLLRRRAETITAVTDTEVIYNDGRMSTDFLGNYIRDDRGRLLTASQYFVTEYSVGKRWPTRFGLTRRNGTKDDVELEFRVIGKESIAVPAGTFEAWRVEGKGYVRGAGALWSYVYWIAPDKVRRFIALEYTNRYRGKLLAADRYELLSFSQS